MSFYWHMILHTAIVVLQVVILVTACMGLYYNRRAVKLSETLVASLEESERKDGE